MAEGSKGRSRLSREHAQDKRSKGFNLRLNTAEREMLDAGAELHGMALSRFLVEAARAMGKGSDLGERREVVDELMRIRTLLGRTSSNVNQIARWANANQAFPDDAAAAVRFARELMVRIDAVVRELV
jgi:uncharacterized protein (DUF1778 family)